LASFIVGVFLLFIRSWLKQKAKKEQGAKPLKDENLNSTWLNKLKKNQGGVLGLVNARKGTSFGGNFLSRNKQLRLRKFALYEEMLAKYKHQLRMQKLHSMSRLVKTMSESHDSEGGNESGEPNTVLKRQNSRNRMKELALRHQMTFDHQLKPAWESVSQTSQEDIPSLQFPGERSPGEKRRNLSVQDVYRSRNQNRSMDSVCSENEASTSKNKNEVDRNINVNKVHVSFNDNKRTVSNGVVDKRTVNNGVVEGLAMKTPLLIQIEDDEEVERDIEKQANIARVQVLKEEYKETGDEVVNKRSSKDLTPPKRPNSLYCALNSRKFTYLPDEESNENDDGRKKSEKRKSWLQGLISSSNSKDNLNKPKDRLSKSQLDDMIEDQLEKAFLSCLPDDVIETIDNIEDVVEVNDMKNKKASSINLSGVQIQSSKRPMTWFAVNDYAKKPSKSKYKKRPKSLTLFERIKENLMGVEEIVDDDDITELFANLMDLKPEKKQTCQYNQQPTINTPPRTDAHINQMLDEVEKRMIKHLHERDDLEENEVLSLEHLLDDIAKFSMDYNEDYNDVEDRRQISFAEANDELLEVESRSASTTSTSLLSSREPSFQKRSFENSSFDERRDKVMSVYDTDLEPTTEL